jgi:hypothetical protein
MIHDDVLRTRFVTARYPQLQGLRLLPLAIVFFASALWRAGAIELPAERSQHAPELWFAGGLAAAICASFVIRRWYNRTLGAIGQRAVHSGAIPIVATTGLAAAATWLQVTLGWHLPLAAIIVGGALAAIGAREYRWRRHYVAAGMALLVYAVLPASGLPVHVLDAIFDGVIALTLLIVGIGDHVLLTNTLRPPVEKLA